MATTNISKKQSLMAQFLTPELRARLEHRVTTRDFRLADCIRSGVENPDSSVGIYAPDAESYRVFSLLFNNVISAYHHVEPRDKHYRDMDDAKLPRENLDPSGESVISTRVRVGRNLAGLPFAPGITNEERKEVEKRIVDALSGLAGDLAGEYHPLSGMAEETRARLVAEHFLFKQGDRFLESAGANRDWPSGRGIFHSADKKFLVWVNEEDQLRIISMEQGGDLYSIFSRLTRALAVLEKKLPFAFSEHLGYLSSCPTNLGTAMRASVHVRLPKYSKHPEFAATCEMLGLSVRGVHGEHSEGEDGVYDISNKRRLGISEVEIAQLLRRGISALLKKEKNS